LIRKSFTIKLPIDLNQPGLSFFFMRVSKKLITLCAPCSRLVDHFGGAPIPIRELARRNDVPKRFLEQIMLGSRRRAGWTAWREFAAAICSPKVRPKSRWARWCGILTAF
jgi:hypothetical protein